MGAILWTGIVCVGIFTFYVLQAHIKLGHEHGNLRREVKKIKEEIKKLWVIKKDKL